MVCRLARNSASETTTRNVENVNIRRARSVNTDVTPFLCRLHIADFYTLSAMKLRTYYCSRHFSLFGIATAICLWLISPGHVQAQGDAFTQEKGKGETWIYFGGGSTRNYFNVDGRQRLFDSLQTSLLTIGTGATLDYGILNNLELNVSLPVSYYRLTSDALFPDRSIFAPDWLGVGLTYQVTENIVHTSVSSQVKIPPGFHDGIYDDPNHRTFLSDGYWQFTNAINIGIVQDDVWLKASAGYTMRGEEPADELLYSAQIGLSRVEGTGIYLGVEGVLSTEDASQPLRPFYAGASGSESEKLRQDGGTGRFSTIDREDYISVRPGVYVELTDQILVSAQYSVRLAGINTLALSGLYAAVGYRF